MDFAPHAKLRDYLIVDTIGIGAYGTVYKAKHIPTKKLVAVKHVILGEANEHDKKRLIFLIREVEIHYRLTKQDESGFVTPLITCIISDHAKQNSDDLREVFLVMDLMHSDLHERIESLDLKPETMLKIVYKILCCIKWMHDRGIIHRDLKPDNFVFDDRGEVRLCDFGLARSLELQRPGNSKQEYKRRPLSPIAYTRWYRPPELILLRKSYD